MTLLKKNSQVANRYESLLLLCQTLERDELSLKVRLDEQVRFIDAFKKDILMAQSALEVYKKAIEILSECGVKRLETLLTKGVSSIFGRYSVAIEVTDYGDKKKANLLLVDGDNKVPIRDGVGGGIKTVVGLILQVYFILHFDLARVLFLDESLTNISAEYVDATFDFMRVLVDEMGFDILIITHDMAVAEKADHVYSVSLGGVYEELKQKT